MAAEKLLWAYNLDHLAVLEAFVAARLRERSDADRAGDGYRRMSMIANPLPSNRLHMLLDRP